jgi:hypothetical protein
MTLIFAISKEWRIYTFLKYNKCAFNRTYILCFRYNASTDKVEMSRAVFKESELKPLGKLCFFIYKLVGVVHITENKGVEGTYYECNNLTLINLVLKFCGPLHERTLVSILLIMQVSEQVQNNFSYNVNVMQTSLRITDVVFVPFSWKKLKCSSKFLRIFYYFC